MASSLRPPPRSRSVPPERVSIRPSTTQPSVRPDAGSSQKPNGVASPSPFPRSERASQPPVSSSTFPRANGRASQRPPSLHNGLADEPIVYEGTEGAFFGSWKNVFVTNWLLEATIPAIDRMLAALAAMPRIAAKRSDIYVIAEGARLPEAAVRSYFIDAIKHSEHELACVAVVVEGSGFWASAVRSFVTGLHWLAPRSFDFRLHSSTDEVLERFPAVHEQLTGVRLDPYRLQRILDGWSTSRRKG